MALVQRMQKKKSLTRKLENAEKQIHAIMHPPKNPNQLYQDGAAVAIVRGSQIDVVHGVIEFPAVTSLL